MSVYGTLMTENNNSSLYENFIVDETPITEATDMKRKSLINKVNGSVSKTLSKVGINADVKYHNWTHGAYKFKNHKQDFFVVEIVIEQIQASTLSSIINALPIPSLIKIVLISIINAIRQADTIEAVKILTTAEDEIQANFKKDIPDYDLKIQEIKKNGKYLNDVLMTISVDNFEDDEE